jgi:hypothetical protein
MQEGPFKRVNFFEGQLLTESDLRDEQEYHNGKRKMLNRCRYGSGVLCGLEVIVTGRSVLVKPGLALDCYGREIYVAEPTKIEQSAERRPMYLLAEYYEYESDPIPGISDTESGEQIQYSRVTEGAKLSWSAENPMDRHQHQDRRWISCGDDHPVPLALVTQERGRLQVDKEFAKTVNQAISDC